MEETHFEVTDSMYNNTAILDKNQRLCW